MCESESRGPGQDRPPAQRAVSPFMHLSHPTSASRPRHQRSGNLKISLYNMCCKVIYEKENTMVDDIKNTDSKVKQYLAIQCPFPLFLILDFYPAAVISLQ